jgi:hypothetical protein
MSTPETSLVVVEGGGSKGGIMEGKKFAGFVLALVRACILVLRRGA